MYWFVIYCLISLGVGVLWIAFAMVRNYRECTPVLQLSVDDGCTHEVWVGGDEGFMKSTIVNTDGVNHCQLCHETVDDVECYES